jgi:uncharacterized Zn-binding protein involved in type VI secretion
MPAVVRLGDKVTCGSISAEGSSTVFANGMPITHAGKPKCTPHGPWVETEFIGPWSQTVFVDGKRVALVGVTKVKPHKKKNSSKKHSGVAKTGSPDVRIEG